jgi:hypothetical protein
MDTPQYVAFVRMYNFDAGTRQPNASNSNTRSNNHNDSLEDSVGTGGDFSVTEFSVSDNNSLSNYDYNMSALPSKKKSGSSSSGW